MKKRMLDASWASSFFLKQTITLDSLKSYEYTVLLSTTSVKLKLVTNEFHSDFFQFDNSENASFLHFPSTPYRPYIGYDQEKRLSIVYQRKKKFIYLTSIKWFTSFSVSFSTCSFADCGIGRLQFLLK